MTLVADIPTSCASDRTVMALAPSLLTKQPTMPPDARRDRRASARDLPSAFCCQAIASHCLTRFTSARPTMGTQTKAPESSSKKNAEVVQHSAPRCRRGRPWADLHPSHHAEGMGRRASALEMVRRPE